MENILKESFKLNTKLMRILRWYPSKKRSRFFTVQAYLLYFCFMLLSVILTVVDMFVEQRYDNLQVIFVCGTVTYWFKIVPFLSNGSRIKQCIKFFNGEDFAPKDTFEEEVINRCMKLCKYISTIYILGITSVELLLVTPSLILKEYHLPLEFWVPYDPYSGPVAYYFTVFYFFIALAYNACATSLIDPLIGGLTYQAVGQFQILKHRLQHLSNRENNLNSSQEIIHQNVKACIQHHIRILRFVIEYEKCFSWSIFSQFLGMTISLGYICLALTTADSETSKVDFYVYICFLVAAIFEVFLFCFFGTLLYEENHTVTTAIYITQWYEYDVKTRKMLILIMERTKKPLILTAEKLFGLTLETFTMILRRSYSLIAVLK